MNKKGMEMIFIIIWLVIGLVVLALTIPALVKSFKHVDSTDDFLKTSDFDGDGQIDRLDKCPCGPDNNPAEMNSALYCLAGYTQDQCLCANSFANSVLKKEMKSKYTKPENMFIWNDASGKCLYKKESCAYLVEAHTSDIENTAQLNACKTLPGE